MFFPAPVSSGTLQSMVVAEPKHVRSGTDSSGPTIVRRSSLVSSPAPSVANHFGMLLQRRWSFYSFLVTESQDIEYNGIEKRFNDLAGYLGTSVLLVSIIFPVDLLNGIIIQRSIPHLVQFHYNNYHFISHLRPWNYSEPIKPRVSSWNAPLLPCSHLSYLNHPHRWSSVHPRIQIFSFTSHWPPDCWRIPETTRLVWRLLEGLRKCTGDWSSPFWTSDHVYDVADVREPHIRYHPLCIHRRTRHCSLCDRFLESFLGGFVDRVDPGECHRSGT